MVLSIRANSYGYRQPVGLLNQILDLLKVKIVWYFNVPVHGMLVFEEVMGSSIPWRMTSTQNWNRWG